MWIESSFPLIPNSAVIQVRLLVLDIIHKVLRLSLKFYGNMYGPMGRGCIPPPYFVPTFVLLHLFYCMPQLQMENWKQHFFYFLKNIWMKRSRDSLATCSPKPYSDFWMLSLPLLTEWKPSVLLLPGKGQIWGRGNWATTKRIFVHLQNEENGKLRDGLQRKRDDRGRGCRETCRTQRGR